MDREDLDAYRSVAGVLTGVDECYCHYAGVTSCYAGATDCYAGVTDCYAGVTYLL